MVIVKGHGDSEGLGDAGYLSGFGGGGRYGWLSEGNLFQGVFSADGLDVGVGTPVWGDEWGRCDLRTRVSGRAFGQLCGVEGGEVLCWDVGTVDWLYGVDV